MKKFKICKENHLSIVKKFRISKENNFSKVKKIKKSKENHFSKVKKFKIGKKHHFSLVKTKSPALIKSNHHQHLEGELPLVPRPGDLFVLADDHVLRVEELAGVLLADVVLGAERVLLHPLLGLAKG